MKSAGASRPLFLFLEGLKVKLRGHGGRGLHGPSDIPAWTPPSREALLVCLGRMRMVEVGGDG